MQSVLPLRPLHVLLLLGLLGAAPARSQEPAEPPAAPAEPELSATALQEAIARIEADASLAAEARAGLLKHYREALDATRSWESSRAADERFQQARKSAPADLKQRQEELASLPAAARVEPPLLATLAELEAELRKAQSAQADAERKVKELEEEARLRVARRSEVPALTAAATTRLEEIKSRLAEPFDAATATPEAQVQRLALRARKRALEADIQALREELLSYDARGGLLTVRQEIATRSKALEEGRVREWQALVNAQREREAQAAAREAARTAARTIPELKELADENVRLAEERRKYPERIEEESALLVQAREQLARTEQAMTSLQQKVKEVGLTDTIGVALRKQYNELPDLRKIEQAIRQRKSVMSEVFLLTLEVNERMQELYLFEKQVQAIVEQVATQQTSVARAEIEAEVRRLLTQQRELLGALQKDLDLVYWPLLLDRDTEDRKLLELTARVQDFIDEHVLWVRSTTALGPEELRELVRLPDVVARIKEGVSVTTSLWRGLISGPLLAGFGTLAMATVLWLRRRTRRKLVELGERTGRASTDSFAATIVGLLITAGLAFPFPALMWLVGRALQADVDRSDYTAAFAGGLQITAVAYYTLHFLYVLCMPRGVADAHFRWRPGAIQALRRNLPLVMIVGLPLLLATTTLTAEDMAKANGVVGQALFVLGQLVLVVFLHRLFRVHDGVLSEIIERSPSSMVARLRYLWYPLAVGLPLFLGVIAASGYLYTAQQLDGQLLTSLWLVMTLVIAQSLVLRWSLVERRRLALAQVARRKEAEAEAEVGSPEVPVPDPDQVDIRAVDVQTRQLLRSFLGFGLLIGLWLVWVDVLPALGFLERMTLWGAEDERITLKHLLVAMVTLALTAAAARNIPGVLEIAVLQRLPLEPGGRYAFSTLCRYGVTLIGLILAFGALGLSWSSIQWLVAAMTVGLGFGLQEIFANFVSGLILLFERPIRVGDTVTIGSVSGVVSRIRIRATTITDWDRKELVVPNKELVTGQVINWTLTDPILRITISVGVAYGSDTERVRRLLLDVAARHPGVLEDPRPRALFMAFGDSALDFELRVFIPSIDLMLETRHDLLKAIDDSFRKAGIEIAFPQRDLHLRSSEAAILIENRSRRESEAAVPEDD